MKSPAFVNERLAKSVARRRNPHRAIAVPVVAMALPLSLASMLALVPARWSGLPSSPRHRQMAIRC